MKIAQINAMSSGISTGRTTFELAKGLEAAGHTSRVFYAYGQNPGGYAICIGNTLDRKLHALLSRLTGLQGYFSHLTTARLIRLLKKDSPDVVHLRNLHSNYINLRMLLRYLAKSDTPTVITLHDCWPFTGKCVHYVDAGCSKWQESCGRCPVLHLDQINPTYFFDTTRKCIKDKKKWFSAIPRLAVVGVSKWVTQEAGNGSIFADRKLVTIYNWIDFSVFHPRVSDLRQKHNLENQFVILAVASVFDRTKGLSEMTEIAARMPENWTMIAIGRITCPLHENIIHIPLTDDINMLAEYYSMADVCLNVTLFETFGKVTAESLSCGTPVIVYRNTASPELVEDGCGEIVEQETGVQGVMEALQKVEKGGKQSYTDACLRKAQKQFRREVGIAAHIELYEQLI